MLKRLTLFLSFFSSILAFSQSVEKRPGPIIVCPAGEFNGHHHVPADDWIREAIENQNNSLRGNETSCANIQVTYNGFTPAAQAAFQAAVDIWESTLSSEVTIVVNANWTVLGEGVLGSAGPAGVFRFFDNAPDNNYYASALADKIAGYDQDPGEPDINANFNSDFDWYLGTDGATPNGQYDLMSVVLHELGHGLGFVSSKDYDEDTGEGFFGLGFQEVPLNYDEFLTLGANGSPLLDIPNGIGLGNAFTSENVFNNSTEAIAANGGTAPRMYAPETYAGGSSISHWNESTYAAGNPNSLMTPQIGSGEAIHNPGGITLGLFEDMGWTLCELVIVDCDIDPLTLDGPESICPDETTTVEVLELPTIPSDGEIAIQFIDVANQTGINLTGVTLPYSFDNDLNGLLSANGFDPFLGEYELTAFVYTDVDDLSGSTCATSSAAVTVYFLDATNPACNTIPVACEEWVSPSTTEGWTNFNDIFGGAPCDDGTGCAFNEIQGFEVWASEAYSIDNFIAGGTYTFSMCNGPGAGSWIPEFTIFAPSGLIDAFGPGDGCSITWTASEDGTYLIVINEQGSCGEESNINNGFPAITCEDGTADCGPSDPCSIEPLVLEGPESICPEESTTVAVISAAEVPAGGGIAIEFLDVVNQEIINLTGVDLPYSFDNDLNGLLSANGFDPFYGQFELKAFVYTDVNDLTNSTCAISSAPLTVYFLDGSDPACNSIPVPCDEWESPSPSTGYVDFNLQFGGAPCDDGTGCPFNEIQTFEVWGSEAYTVDNFMAGGSYTFSICNGPGAGSWDPDFTIYAPSGAIDAFGPGDGCAITWTASEDGTYIIVINEAGNCGVENSTNNGYPALTCEDETADCSVEPCSIDQFSLDGPASICPGESTSVETTNPPEVPEGGGIAIEFLNVGSQEALNITGVELPYTFDNDLNGLLSANGFNPFVGEYELRSFVYTDVSDLQNSTCAISSTVVTVNFLEDSDPKCVNGIDDEIWENAWEIFPNPAHGKVTVRLKTEVHGDVSINIYDVSGRLVKQIMNIHASGNNNNWQMDISSLHQGVYYVVIENSVFKASKPLLISK